MSVIAPLLIYFFIFLVAPVWIFISLGQRRQNNIRQGKPVPKWIGFVRGLLTVYFVFLVLFLVAGGLMWVVQIPLTLMFGWIPFLIEKIPNMVFNWDGIVLSLGGLIVLVAGGHAFMKWLYGHWGVDQDNPPTAPTKGTRVSEGK